MGAGQTMEGTAASVSHRDAWLVCTPSKLVLLLFVLEIALMLRGFQSGWLALLGILAFVLAILGLVACLGGHLPQEEVPVLSSQLAWLDAMFSIDM